MQAIYYPKLSRLTYWDYIPGHDKLIQYHHQPCTLPQARAYLREIIVRTEIIQALEVFKVP